MAFSLNTNVASLTAQDYLRITSDFQTKTINRVTSGLRIVSSGDDAAGLAIANSFRSDRAVLTQGVRNANDGLSTLQTIDGGLNNISQLLDRARTLAAQSASGTFNGDRNVLNSEFQSVITEIDRQAQAIGLNTGGAFAATLSVFIGGGRGQTSVAQIANGSVSVDLSGSTVDTQSLGLKGYQAVGGTAGTTDIGPGSATSVFNILADPTNVASEAVAGFADFYFRGPGFANADRIRVSVNLSGVTDTTTLVNAVNGAIDAAGAGASQQATMFANAGIRASAVTDPATGTQRLAFTSSNAAFQVAAGDRVANALMGNFSSGATGSALTYSVAGASSAAATSTTFGAAGAGDIIVRFLGGSLGGATDITLTVAAGATIDQALASLASQVANNSQLQAAGISMTAAAPGAPLAFTGNRNEKFEVLIAGDKLNLLGMGSARIGASGVFDSTSITGAGGAFNGAGTNSFQFSIGGGAYTTPITVTTSASTTIADVINQLNAAFSADAALQAAGLVATNSGGQVRISSSNGSYFRLNLTGVTGGVNLGFGTTAGVTTTTTVATNLTTSNTTNSGGASTSGPLSFQPIRLGTDDQTITVTAVDSSGSVHSLPINLAADATAQRARSIDEAIHYINQQLQQSNDAALKQIVAVKEFDPVSGEEKVRFLSSLGSFKVSVGDNPGDTGITDSQGAMVSSTTLGGGATADISTKANAEAAVTALATSVTLLGSAQAVVGKGQNQFNFAISLAQTQLNNLAASESRIRDADLAAEAANLTKAQILLQAGIAAVAQANVAPQVVLRLLQG
jgi:flagellin